MTVHCDIPLSYLIGVLWIWMLSWYMVVGTSCYHFPVWMGHSNGLFFFCACYFRIYGDVECVIWFLCFNNYCFDTCLSAACVFVLQIKLVQFFTFLFLSSHLISCNFLLLQDCEVGMAATATGPRYAPEDPTLPKPWKGLVDGKTGYLYFWNPETNVTQYERPERPGASSNASLAPPPKSSASISSSVQVQQSSQGQRRDHGLNEEDDKYNRARNLQVNMYLYFLFFSLLSWLFGLWKHL